MNNQEPEYTARNLYELSVTALEQPGFNTFADLRPYVNEIIQREGIMGLQKVTQVADRIKKEVKENILTVSVDGITPEMVVKELLGLEEIID